ncbi:hypothetical protein D3C72_2360990 [compost metagenome]
MMLRRRASRCQYMDRLANVVTITLPAGKKGTVTPCRPPTRFWLMTMSAASASDGG